VPIGHPEFEASNSAIITFFVILDTVLSIKASLTSCNHFMITNNSFIALRSFMMTNTRHLFPGLWKMDFISARLTKLSTQRAIRGFVALLVTSATFWCLISGDDALQNSSTHHSDGVNLVPRRTVKIQTPGAIAGLVVGTILGVLAAIGVIVWLVYHVNRKVNRYSGRHVETRWPSARDSSTASVTINNIYPCNIYPRNLTGKFYTGEIRLRGVLSDLFDRTPPFGETDSATNSGPPKQFWRPTEQERDLASRISLDGSPSLAIPTAAKQAPPEGSEYDPVFKLSSPDLESKILLPESVTPALKSS
jgi:hypothetical protein